MRTEGLIEASPNRPKSLVVVSIKLPEELVEDIDHFCGMYRPPKTRSAYIKDACEFVGIIKHGSKHGLYRLREL